MADELNNQPQIDEETFAATQGLIQRLSNQMEDINKKYKEAQQMLKNVFENDAEMHKASEVANEAKQTLTSRKKELNETQAVKDLKVKISDLREDKKMIQESLNTHLINYFQMTNSTTVDLPNGDEREFKLTAKLKGKKK